MLGRKMIDMRQRTAEDLHPIGAAGRRGGIGKGHIERGGDAVGAHAAQDGNQLRAVVLVHAAHQRRIAEMKELRRRGQIVAHIRGREGVVGARIMEEDAVHLRRVDADRVGGRGRGIDDHAIGEPGAARLDDLAHGLPEQVGADLAHQPRRDAQPVQRQPDVRHRAAGGERGRAALDQVAGRERPLEGLAAHAGELRDDIQADVPGDDDGHDSPFQTFARWHVERLNVSTCQPR